MIYWLRVRQLSGRDFSIIGHLREFMQLLLMLHIELEVRIRNNRMFYKELFYRKFFCLKIILAKNYLDQMIYWLIILAEKPFAKIILAKKSDA